MREDGYASVLRSPHVARTAGPYALSRVGVGMELLALLLFVHDRTGTFVQAGLINASFAVGAALTAPALGRAVDRRGQQPVLSVCAVVHLVAVLAVVLGAGRVPGLAVVGAAVAGAAMPPLSSCMRVLWPTLVEERLRGTAYSIESLLVEGAELCSPALVGALLWSGSPALAVLLAGCFVSLGALVFSTSPPSREWRTQRRAPRPAGLLPTAGPMRVRGVRLLVTVVFLTTASLAALEVAIARFASGAGHTALSGVLLGALVTGSLLGAWAYGRRPRERASHDQAVRLLGASALLSLLPLLATGVWSMAGLLLLTGCLIAPATSVLFLVMTEVAPEDSRTEAFTWASTTSFLGVAVGTALAGSAVSGAGTEAGLLLSTGFAVLALLVGVRLRRAVRPRAAEPVLTVWVEEYDEVVRERDEALAEVRRAGARCDELARELARLRQERFVAPAQRTHLRAVDDLPAPAERPA